jgi:6-phosphogluconate dehydrogenase
MIGGDDVAVGRLEPIFETLAPGVESAERTPGRSGAVAPEERGWLHCGPNGAGHFVKMVHNGIEYGDMQMICEAYQLMGSLLHMEPAGMSKVFGEWDKGVLDSFLIEITTDILQQTDPETGKPFVDIVLDTAGQKGTGRWTAVNSLEMGVPAPLIAEAVYARCVSALKDERVAASKILSANVPEFDGDKEEFVQAIHDALYCSKICSYAQGFQLMRAAQEEYGWDLNFGEISMIWRGGCIIRAAFLQKIFEAYQRDSDLANLLLDPFFKSEIERCEKNWRKVVAAAATHGVPVPAFSSALAYFDSYRSERLPANLLQSQRDYFGAHTYERLDKPRGEFYHIDWPEPGRPQLEM